MLGTVVIPTTLAYNAMHTLSFEARQKLADRQPTTLAQAGSIPGVSPADLQNLAWEIERMRRNAR
jgi:tRNA uridine 5-carboxymethylaminomethyl modification enzyme